MQLKLNFSGKKTERITFAATEDLRYFLDRLVKKLNRDSISDLIAEYVIECATRDMGKLMLLEARNEKKIINIDPL